MDDFVPVDKYGHIAYGHCNDKTEVYIYLRISRYSIDLFEYNGVVICIGTLFSSIDLGSACRESICQTP